MAHPKLTEADHLATSHLNTTRAAEVLGVSHGAVKRLRERLGVESKDGRSLGRNERDDWLATTHMTTVAAAAHLGVSTGYIQHLRERLDPPGMDRASAYQSQRKADSRKRREERASLRLQREADRFRTKGEQSRLVTQRAKREEREAARLADREMSAAKKTKRETERAEALARKTARDAHREAERRKILAEEEAKRAAQKAEQEFDATPYDALVNAAAQSFLIDTGYAIRIATVAGRLVYNRREKQMSKHSSTSTKWQKTRLLVLNRDAWTCMHCGKGLVEGHKDLAPEVDHLTPKSKGGTDDAWNLVASCRKCNNDKSDKKLVRTNWWNKHWLEHL